MVVIDLCPMVCQTIPSETINIEFYVLYCVYIDIWWITNLKILIIHNKYYLAINQSCDENNKKSTKHKLFIMFYLQ